MASRRQNILMQQPTWSYLIPIAAALIAALSALCGVIGQQAADIWKTSRLHRQELQRRMFDAKFKSAADLSAALYASARYVRARLAEAEEWCRTNNRDDVLAVRQRTVEAQGEVLEKAFHEAERALGLMEFLFPPEVSLYSHDGHILSSLEDAWREFESRRVAFKTQLNALMPDNRAAELRLEMESGSMSAQSQEEIRNWMNFYSTGLADITSLLPQLRDLTNAYDVGTHKAIQLLRNEFSRYER